MTNALTRLLRHQPAQTHPLPGTEMEQNAAGGYSFPLDKWKQLERFLILGSDNGTFYASEHKLTVDNVDVVEACVLEDPTRTVDLLVEVSTGSLAPKNTPAIFALAVCASAAAPEARAAANSAVTQVCRTGTQLYQFADFVKLLGRRGWGRGLRTALANALTEPAVERLALHAVKYRQRDGWTYRDLLRLCHAQTDQPDRNLLFSYMVGKAGLSDIEGVESLRVLEGFLRISKMDATTPTAAARLIADYRLPWEAVPDPLRQSTAVWEALLPFMGVTALTRNLATFARLGMLRPLSWVEQHVVSVLTDADKIHRSREHPVRFLDAQLVHASGGHAGRSHGSTYRANPSVLDALDQAFRLAFGNVMSSGARTYVGLDVSGSMGFSSCAGSAVLTPREGAAAMAVITAAAEQSVYVGAFSHKMVPVDITGTMTVRDAMSRTAGMPFGATDCAQPMLDALERGIEADLFVVYTDNETWAGTVHPVMALRRYRAETGIPAKLAVVAMTSTGFSIADPDDAGMMDLVGFSTATPQILSGFGSGRI